MEENREMSLRVEGFKQKFVIGGFWTMTDKDLKESLFKRAKSDNETIHNGKFQGASCLETSDINEMQAFGLFTTMGKHSVSLAGCLARAYSKDSDTANSVIINMFPVVDDNGRNFWWISIIENGIVQTDGDRIVDDENFFDVEGEVLKDYEGIDFVVNKTENFAQSVERIGEILGGLTKKEIAKSKIVSFTGARKTIIKCVVAGVILVAAGVFGWNEWQDYREQQEAVAEKMRLEQQARRRLDTMKKSEFPPIWLNEPTTMNVFHAVRDQLDRTPLAINGWTLKAFRYGRDRFYAAYTRKETELYTPPPGRIDGKNKANSIVVTQAKIPKGKRQQGIMRRDRAEDWLARMSMGRPWKLSWKMEKPPTKTINIGNQQITIKAAYQICKVTLDKVSTVETAANILDLPGFVVDSVTWNGKEWSIKGNLYVLP